MKGEADMNKEETAFLDTAFLATPEGDRRQKILQERAKALAIESELQTDDGETLEVLEFLLADEVFSIDSSYIREVLPLKEITQLPCTPSFVLGIINVRGQILSVIDLKRFFDLTHQGLTNLNKIILLHTDDIELGILADMVLGIRTVRQADILPPPPTLTGISEEYLKGVTPERLMVLNTVKILNDPRIVVHEEVV
jgi:purine-binding chemotaxis protein CheW